MVIQYNFVTGKNLYIEVIEIDGYIISENIDLEDYSCEHFSFYLYEDTIAKGMHLKNSTIRRIEVRKRDERKIPHLHLFMNNNDKEICIRIDTNRYYNHSDRTGGNFLNDKDKKAFNKFMGTIDPKYGISYWERAKEIWNSVAETAINGQTSIIPDDVKQPNYSTMKNIDL
jgi:hypothetical protein